MFGQILGAALPFLGGAMDRRDKRTHAGREMAQKIETGKRFGLHPLASIGAQTSGFQPVMSQAMTSAGQSIQQGMARAADRKGEAALQRKQEQLIDEQILEARSRTLLNTANARRAAVGPGSAVDPYAPRKENALISVRLENGETVLVPNPDVYEISPTELATGRIVLEGGRQVERATNPKPRSSGADRRSWRTGR